jgi:hypothetical protein
MGPVRQELRSWGSAPPPQTGRCPPSLDRLRNRATVEFLGIWESIRNPRFDSLKFAIIKSQAALHSYKLSVKERVEK